MPFFNVFVFVSVKSDAIHSQRNTTIGCFKVFTPAPWIRGTLCKLCILYKSMWQRNFVKHGKSQSCFNNATHFENIGPKNKLKWWISFVSFVCLLSRKIETNERLASKHFLFLCWFAFFHYTKKKKKKRKLIATAGRCSANFELLAYFVLHTVVPCAQTIWCFVCYSCFICYADFVCIVRMSSLSFWMVRTSHSSCLFGSSSLQSLFK